MLITQLKPKDTIEPLISGGSFILCCEGCKEVYFPALEAAELRNELQRDGKAAGTLVCDYICNPDNLRLQLGSHMAELEKADSVLVLSCGVGVQTVAEACDTKKVYAGCDSYQLPGFQGVTPLEYACGQCGECYLNETGGICPVTACSKSLINGQCGGAKNGKCEVDSEMDCGWERIYRKLEKLNRLAPLTAPAKIRNYAPGTAEAGN